jgi:hypothetical protein
MSLGYDAKSRTHVCGFNTIKKDPWIIMRPPPFVLMKPTRLAV